MGPPSALRATAVLALALSLAGCGDAIAPPHIPISPAVVLNAETAVNLRVCIDDAVDRIMPALGTPDELTGIASSLTQVNSALDSRGTVQLSKSVEAYKQALDAFFATRPELAFDPDAEVLRLLMVDLTAVAANPPLDTLRNH
jgi:hypothetical protein